MDALSECRYTKYIFLILTCVAIFIYYFYQNREIFLLTKNSTHDILISAENSTHDILISAENSTHDILTSTENSTASVKTYYILQWTSGKVWALYPMGAGRDKYIELNCPHQNCFVTDHRRYLPHLTDYDAIVFNGNDVVDMNRYQLPQERLPSQKYVFGATEPAPTKLACKPVLDNFFNWTWTYRLDADIRWAYVLIYDLDGVEIGPKLNMEWPKELKPIEDEETKAILNGKSKAAAWFVSHCQTEGHRENFVDKVKPEMAKLNMTLDVYGKCSNLKCPMNQDDCFNMVKKDYYFYFSFENSFSTDYVTEKLLTALNNYAIPVVYGGADYSRFLPPGTYLNALELGPQKLVTTMKEIMENKTRYVDFFRWRNHFTYKRGENHTEMCNLCTALNDDKKRNRIDILDHFREWWNEKDHSRCRN